jgi:hypothetical protein
MNLNILILMCTLLCTLSGCFVGRVYEGAALDEARVDQIVPRQTSKDDIISWFGPPKSFTRPILFDEIAQNLNLAKAQREGSIFQEAFTYEYKRGNAFLLFLILYNYVELDIKSDYLLIFFNNSGTVENWAFAEDTELLRSFGFLSGSPPQKDTVKGE